MIELRTITTPLLPVQVLQGGEGADLGTAARRRRHHSGTPLP